MKKSNNILYKLFDSNVYGKFSQCSLFFGALSLVAGQFLGASILLGLGGVSLGASICKNIIDTRKIKNFKQSAIEVPYEEYTPEQTTQKENTIQKPQTHENYTYSNKDNSNDRSL